MDTLVRVYRQAHATFWSEKYWLAANQTWDMFANRHSDEILAHGSITDSSIHRAQPRELLWCVPIALLLLILRRLFEVGLMRPLAQYLGLCNGNEAAETNNKAKPRSSKRPDKCAKLESHFKAEKRPNGKELERLAYELEWTLKRVQNWFRLRRNLCKSSKMKKFCEAGWRFAFYFLAVVGGLYVLHDEAFFYDWRLSYDLMDAWPDLHVKREYFYYYAGEMAFYLSLLASLFTDVRRSDFWEHCIHHLVTIVLMFISWSINFVPLGLMLLIVHDTADSWLEAAKMAIYVGRRDLSNALFVVFLLVWIVTRTAAYPLLLVYPCWLRYISFYDQRGHIYSILTNLCFMSVLVVLNAIWTILIMNTLYKGFRTNFDDVRSESESENETSENETVANGCRPLLVLNGKTKTKLN